jgi:hypothetical protein
LFEELVLGMAGKRPLLNERPRVFG